MYITPKTIIIEFLRTRLVDPRGRAESTKTNVFTATAAQTVFQLTPTLGYKYSCTVSVTDNATPKVKWRDYYIDTKAQQIVFYTGITVGHTITVIFKEGDTNWIYPDKPNEKLDSDAFPRLSLLTVGTVGDRLGNYEAPVEGLTHFQVDIWAKEKQLDNIFTIAGKKFIGEDLAEYLAYQITIAFENYESDMHPGLYSYDPINMPHDLPFDVTHQSHHKVVEFLIRGIGLGRIS